MRTNRVLAVSLVLMIAALVVVGTLQYRWLDRVAEGERQQMRRNLEFTLERLDGDLSSDIHNVFRAFLGPEDEDALQLLDAWESSADHPELVASIYVAERDSERWTIRKFDRASRELIDAPLPSLLEPLRRALDEVGERGPDERFPQPVNASIPALFVISMPPQNELEFDRRPKRVIFVQLDREALGRLVAQHAERVAEGLDVELTAGSLLLYRSPGAPTDHPPDIEKAFRPVAPRERPRVGLRERPRREPPPGDEWRLALSHRRGGLDAIVASAHRRNLALAALVLLLLAAATALLVALLRRGERLRAQQSQFVAAMSHELNTPLAILRVASENLHDGIVQDPEKVSRYVRTIARETAHLSEMVNHVLELAGMRAGVALAGRQPIDIGAVIQEAVTQSRLLGTADLSVDVDVPSDLPRVHGDERSLTRAMQNLVTNAIRHAGAGKWVGVRAARDDGFVRIVIEDRGPGIAAADAPHVFEPFYRGSNSGSVRGTGLGLTIVKQIVDEHGGSIAIERGRPAGAAFVVRLPVEAHS